MRADIVALLMDATIELVVTFVDVVGFLDLMFVMINFDRDVRIDMLRHFCGLTLMAFDLLLAWTIVMMLRVMLTGIVQSIAASAVLLWCLFLGVMVMARLLVAATFVILFLVLNTGLFELFGMVLVPALTMLARALAVALDAMAIDLFSFAIMFDVVMSLLLFLVPLIVASVLLMVRALLLMVIALSVVVFLSRSSVMLWSVLRLIMAVVQALLAVVMAILTLASFLIMRQPANIRLDVASITFALVFLFLDAAMATSIMLWSRLLAIAVDAVVARLTDIMLEALALAALALDVALVDDDIGLYGVMVVGVKVVAARRGVVNGMVRVR